MQTFGAMPDANKEKQAVFPRGKRRVLVMDDDEYVRGIIRSALREHGYRPRTARDGNQAIRMFLAGKKAGLRFDAVILDMVVPRGISGHEVFEQLRAMDPGIRAVLLTGDINHQALVRYSECGFRTVLLKPFTSAELIQSLEWAMTD